MKIEEFSKTYDGRLVLHFPETEPEPGKIYAVFGANGSGKSTLARIIAGIETADGGGHPSAKINTGYMPQKSFAFRMSVEKNILLGGSDVGRCSELLDGLMLTRLKGKNARTLSGGETERMALARLMMRKYELLVLDEPTASMDMEGTLLAEALIQKYRDETQCAVFLITHSLQQAKRMADEAMYFENGELIESGPIEAVLSVPRDSRTRRFIDFYGV